MNWIFGSAIIITIVIAHVFGSTLIKYSLYYNDIIGFSPLSDWIFNYHCCRLKLILDIEVISISFPFPSYDWRVLKVPSFSPIFARPRTVGRGRSYPGQKAYTLSVHSIWPETFYRICFENYKVRCKTLLTNYYALSLITINLDKTAWNRNVNHLIFLNELSH